MKVDRTGVFGVVLAGGASRRFGRPKAWARIGGIPLAQRSIDTLVKAGLSAGLVSGDRDLAVTLGVDSRPDLQSGLGPLGGLWTALEWARERGDDAAVVLGCDMPFVPPDLIGLLVARAGSASAVVPSGPDGVQPLCALYRTACLPEVTTRIRAGDLSMHGLLRGVEAEILSQEAVAGVVDPGRAFWNVNTPADLDRAEERVAVNVRRTP